MFQPHILAVGNIGFAQRGEARLHIESGHMLLGQQTDFVDTWPTINASEAFDVLDVVLEQLQRIKCQNAMETQPLSPILGTLKWVRQQPKERERLGKKLIDKWQTE